MWSKHTSGDMYRERDSCRGGPFDVMDLMVDEQ